MCNERRPAGSPLFLYIPADKDIGKEYSLEVQDVIDKINTSYNIDKVNKIWGENHEEKRKKIFWGNVLRIPLRVFLGFSIIYFSPFIINLPTIIKSPEKVDSVLWALIRTFFNSPYYIFDLRIGIIASIASLLLSLFVSVGKFADGAGGINGEARRAAYRQFARVVGYIVFCVFVIVFWHGLLAGYFQGVSYAPEFFGDWANGPGWGKQVVPPDIKLERYADMPLWILLFFAWFTLSSSLMLTYNERDILVKYASVLRRVKNASSLQDMSSELAYRIIYKENVNTKKGLSISGRADNNDMQDESDSSIADFNGFNSIFLRSREYIGFSVKGVAWAYFSGVEGVKIIVLWLVAVLVSLTFPSGRGGMFIVLVTLLFVSCLFSSISLNTRLFSEICKFNVSGLKSGRLKFFERCKFYGLTVFNVAMIWIVTSMISIYVVEVFIMEIAELFSGCCTSWDSYGDLPVFAFLLINLLFACFVAHLMNKEIRCIIRNIVDKRTYKYFSGEIEEMIEGNRGSDKGQNGVDCILTSYVYCLIKNISEIYSEYKYESESVG